MTHAPDGEQSGCSTNVPEKLRMAPNSSNWASIFWKPVFPIASEGDFGRRRRQPRIPWVQVAALARSMKLDVERAARSLEKANGPRIHTFLAQRYPLKVQAQSPAGKYWTPRCPRSNWPAPMSMMWSSPRRTEPALSLNIWNRSRRP